MIRKTTFTLLCLLALQLHGADNIESDQPKDNESESTCHSHVEQLILASLREDIPFDIAQLDEEEVVKAIEKDLEVYKKAHPEDPEGLDFLNLDDAELVEAVETTTTEKDLTEFPIEEELFKQDLFSDLGFDANIEDLDTILKSRDFEPQPPSKLIQFLSKGYPLFAYTMRCKNSVVATCKTIRRHIAAQITALARKISCS